MRFFVTYCAMDGTLANPLWHACVILSYWPGEGEKVEIKNAVGFYGGPLSSPDSLLTKIKKKLGLGFDFYGNFGLLKSEEIRWLDLGHGLRGMSFEITLERFMQLKKICKEELAAQRQAIDEIKKELTTDGQAPNPIEIFEEEKRRALKDNRAPRLEPFDFQVSVDLMDGISLNNSHTCKTKAIKLLKQIEIKQEYLDLLTDYNTSMAIPRIGSDHLEQFFLHSVGPRIKHVSERTGNMSFFRKWDQKGTRLFWSLPPQNLMTNSSELKELFILPETYVEQIKGLLSKLQQIEHIVVDTSVGARHEAYKQRLIDTICHFYDSFGTLTSKRTNREIEGKIAESKDLLNNLYFAINESWDDMDEVESIVGEFPTEAQKKICAILGRSMEKDVNLTRQM